MNKRIALFPGSFDPFTCGHTDIVARGLQLFERVIIGIGYNEQKRGMIPVEERLVALRTFYRNEPRISVEAYRSLTTDFAMECGVGVLLRGVRSLKDYDYELAMADVNRQLCPSLETVILLARPELACLSSSTVRELHHFEHEVAQFLPPGLCYPSLSKSPVPSTNNRPTS